ncbi:MAG: hypothetical protein V1794_01950 [Candidatus Glassbacteria bacterium]
MKALESATEQLERAAFFYNMGMAFNNHIYRFRFMMASLYFARSICEIMLESAKQGNLKISSSALKKKFKTILPRYELIQLIRIHDFHRCVVLEREGILYVSGPIHIKAGRHPVSIRMKPEGGIKVEAHGESRVDLNRPLQQQNGCFWDESNEEYISIDKALVEYLGVIPKAIEYFKQNIKPEYVKPKKKS